MELNSKTIRVIDSNEIYDLLANLFNDIYHSFLFTGLSLKDYKELVIREIDKSKSEYLGKSTYEEYIKEKVNDVIHKLIKVTLTNSENARGIINNYIDYFFSNLSNPQDIIRQLNDLYSFFKVHDYTLDPDKAILLLKSNPSFNQKIRIIVDKYYDKIIEGNAETIFNNDLMLLFVETYCNLNNISIKEDGYDITEDDFKDININVLYLREMAMYPLLSVKEERELALKTASGDKKAREKFIDSNLRLVINVAKRYLNYGLSFLDLIQEGNIGLMKAVDGYKLEKGNRFSTYAVWWIRQAITRAIADTGRTIRIPAYKVADMVKYRRTIQNLKQESVGDLSIDEISQATGFSEKQITDMEKLFEQPISINQLIGDDDDRELEEVLVVNNERLDDKIVDDSVLDAIMSLLDNCYLTEREKNVLLYRHGFINNRVYTLEEIGAKYSVTRERIRQIEAKALMKVRKSKLANGLAIYTADPDVAIESLNKIREEYFKAPNQSIAYLKIGEGNKERNDNKMSKSVKNIYEMFSKYSKAQIIVAIEKLSEEDIAILKYRYGDNFDSKEPNKLLPEDLNRIYGSIIPRIKRLLENPNIKIRQYKKNRVERKKTERNDKLPFPGVKNDNQNSEHVSTPTTIILTTETENAESKDKLPFPGLKTEDKNTDVEPTVTDIALPKLKTEKQLMQDDTTTNVVESNSELLNTISKSDSLKILELLRTPSFGQIMEELSPKEAVIISLRLGYVDGKYFSTDAIANFLGMEEKEVIEITRKVLLLYKDNINELLDKLINVATNKNDLILERNK